MAHANFGLDVYFRILNNEASGELTYLLADLDAREGVLIDPHACDLPVLLALLAERDLRLRWVLRTHHHDALLPDERAGLERPVQQHKVRYGPDRYRVDFAWPKRKLFLEGNSFGFHALSTDLDRDARRQNSFVLDGWRPITITWRMTDSEIATTIAAFLARL